MTRRLLAGAFAALGAAVTLAGCGSEPDAPAGDQVNAAAVSWAEQVCASVGSGGDTLSELPAFNPEQPDATRDGLVTYLESMSAALSDVADTITAAGTPPVEGGGATVEQAMETISTEREALESAKTTLTKAEITDEASFQQAISEVRTAFDELSSADGPLKDLKTNPELNEAIGRASACQGLDTGA
ncbi:hypothetical protein SAMN05216266_14317 [Amycolatopsis marina]|uniref:Small secreted protein n=1 Tax=Amycolatopsis marina TaxID=490629 RepID=A0A1I1CVI7_9PSEU|nr:hypothetical protein [Amycolatopsis marina]SFB64433.1 hypothetical protein SAMN05216266_14317 [Amycolatopsis marina]